MMRKSITFALLIIVLLLAATGCDPEPAPFLICSSINGDGTGLHSGDLSLKVFNLGRAFYAKDNLVFHLGSRLYSHDLDTGSYLQLTPSDMTISDTKNLAIDNNNHLLYFAAGYAIWKVGFNGNGLTRLSPEVEGQYSAPVLSSGAGYLTAIKDGQICRLNLQSGEWTELASPTTAQYAVYYSDTDEYYFFSVIKQNYNNSTSLNKINAAGGDSIQLMAKVYSGDSDGLILLRSSQHHRYLAMHNSLPPRQLSSWMGPDYWERYTQELLVFDRATGTVRSIPACFAYSLVENTDQLVFSRYKYGMSDLMRMNLSTGESTMIWDGYYAPGNYSYCIEEIYPLYEGQKIHLKAWRRRTGSTS